MPLKINEMVIQASFDDSSQNEKRPAVENSNATTAIDTEAFREEIIRECLDRVKEYMTKQAMR